MQKKIVGLVISILIIASLTLGCFQDSDNNGKKKSNEPPNADAGTDLEVSSGIEIEFDGSNSSDPDGEIESYFWDFGDTDNSDKATSTDSNPKYTYEIQGDYVVTLTVTDEDGESASDTLRVTVNNRKPVVDIGENVTANVFDVIYFEPDAVDYDGYIRSFSWDFGDDSDPWFAAATGSTTHFYEEPGEYNAELSVTDNSEEVTIVSKKITIIEITQVPPLADAGLNQTTAAGQILLKGTGFDTDGVIEKFEWDFDGDGDYDWSSSNTGITNHDYVDEGKFNAKLRVTDDSGLTATDIVTIVINNSYAAQNVSAKINIDWSTSYDYLISLNNEINNSNIKVVITDIIIEEHEEFQISDMTIINQRKFKLTSTLIPVSKRSLQVQVFYYDTLIGARGLDIVNESYEFIGPELDFEAIFDFEQELEELDRGEIDEVKITSIGELEIKRRGDLYYTSIHGTGEYYILDNTDDVQSETWINCTDLWVNITLSGTELVSKSLSISGTGTMVATYDGDLTMNLNIEEMRLVTENNVQIENFVYGEGTFSGTTKDPESGLTLEMEGDVYFTSELLGNGNHKNFKDEEYSCSIQYTNVSLDGDASLPGGGFSVPVESVMENTSWIVDFEKYSNNTIYYEYTSTTEVAGMKYDDSGLGYPKNSPSRIEEMIHIEDVILFDTPRPRVILFNDTLLLESTHGVELELKGIAEIEAKVGTESYECVDLEGEFISGAEGYVEIRMIILGNFAGIPVYSIQEIQWKEERLMTEETLKRIQT